MTPNNIDRTLPERQMARLSQRVASETPLNSGDDGGRFGGMDDDRLKLIDGRLTAIESEQRAHLRWTVTTALALSAIIAASTGFMVSRVDRLEDRLTRLESNVSELPGKISAELRDINKTLAQAITASKQTPPQVILMPSPQLPAEPKPN